MPTDDPVQRFSDILEKITLIQTWTSEMDQAALAGDLRTTDAVLYCLLVISEAASKLGKHAEQLCPGIPWRKIRATGNWLRHGYDKVDTTVIWTTITDDLPALRAACEGALAAIDRQLESARKVADRDQEVFKALAGTAKPEE